MAENIFDPRDLIAATKIGILATLKSSGLPQLSPVTAVYDRDADIIYVSMTDDRAKTKNLRRDPRAAIEFIPAPTAYTWATAEGAVELIGPGTDPTVRKPTPSSTTTERGAGEDTPTGPSTGR